MRENRHIAPRIQILTTTHSPHMLDYFDPEEIFPAEFKYARTVIGTMSRHQKKAVTEKLLSASEVMTSQGFELD